MIIVSKKSGVTLIELLLVIAILSVVAAVGFPTVWQNTGRRADQKTAQGVASDIEYVRSMALMDMPGFANAKFRKNDSKYEIATRTKELTGNYQVADNVTLNFNPDGSITSPKTIHISRKSGGGGNIAHIDIASSGLITWGTP